MINLANSLTILRIFMTPVIAILLVYDLWRWGLTIFLLAGITDALDGFIARTRAQRTELGMILDPLADKLLLSSTFVTLVSLGQIPQWLFIIVISRDLIVIGGFLVVYIANGKATVSVSWMGKLTTGLQVLTVLATLMARMIEGVASYVPGLIYLAATVTILSGLGYVRQGARALSQ